MVWTVLGVFGWIAFGTVSLWFFGSMLHSQEKRQRLASYAASSSPDDELRSPDHKRLQDFCGRRLVEGFQKPLLEAVTHDRFIQALADDFWDREKVHVAAARKGAS